MGINYSNGNCTLNKNFYDDLVDADSVTIGDYELTCFTSENNGYPLTQYISIIDEGCITITLWQDREEGTVDIEDELVYFIIKSIELTLE